MTIPYHPMPLKCSNLLIEHTKTFFERFNDDNRNLYIEWVPIDPDLRKIVDDELSEYGLPPSWTFLGFKRRNDFDFNIKTLHMDSDEKTDKVHTSIVLPVANCHGTYMYWTSNNYTEEIKVTPVGSHYIKAVYDSDPEYVYPIEIATQPYVTRVDIPHSATSNKDGSFRVTLTIRLKSNPKFESVVNTIKQK
jgi:hypothetical protein